MSKRLTRKKLLRRLENLKAVTSVNPIMMLTINFSNDHGAMFLDKREVFSGEILSGRDKVIARLMDLSLTHRVVDVFYSDGRFSSGGVGGTWVSFTVVPDREYKTNIDGEFMERIMEWNFEHDGNGKAVK